MQLEIFLSPLNEVWGMRLQIGGKTRKSLIFRGVWARKLGRNETYIYQLNSEAGAGKMFNFWELFFPVIRNEMFRFPWNIYVPHQNRTYISERVTLDRNRNLHFDPYLRQFISHQYGQCGMMCSDESRHWIQDAF